MLISRSAVFAAMILGDTIDSSQPFITIPDVTPEAFKNTLQLVMKNVLFHLKIDKWTTLLIFNFYSLLASQALFSHHLSHFHTTATFIQTAAH